MGLAEPNACMGPGWMLGGWKGPGCMDGWRLGKPETGRNPTEPWLSCNLCLSEENGDAPVKNSLPGSLKLLGSTSSVRSTSTAQWTNPAPCIYSDPRPHSTGIGVCESRQPDEKHEAADAHAKDVAMAFLRNLLEC